MKEKRLGKLPPRYGFILNPYPDTRVTRCPKCQQPNRVRKFVFFIHIDGWGPLSLGKTGRFCPRCDLIILHQDELEQQLAYTFSTLAPGVIGNDYLVVGTVERSVWRKGLKGQGPALKEVLDHVADFKKVFDLKVEPGGWYPAGKDK